MRISKAPMALVAIAIPLTACGQLTELPRPLPPAPFAYLSLAACRNYSSNIVECQLEYGTEYARHRLGPVQDVARALVTGREGNRYQVSSCWPVQRIQRELPNFVCRIYGSRSGSDAGPVLIKGGTAVRLAQILGDREQVLYRWTPDRWSRLRD